MEVIYVQPNAADLSPKQIEFEHFLNFPVKFTFTLQHCDEILKPVFGKTLGHYLEYPKVFDFEKHFGVFTGYFIVLYCFVFRKPLFTK